MKSETDKKTNLISLKKDLELLGLTDKELVVYIAALQFTTFSVFDIAKKSGIKRPTCYIVLESLLQKGVVAKAPDSRNSRFTAVSPQIILEKTKNSFTAFEKAVTVLSSLRNVDQNQAHIELFRGVDGVKQIHYLVLDDNPTELESIVNPSFIRYALKKDFIDGWIKNRIDKNIKVRSLRPLEFDEKNKPISSTKQKGREVRSWPKEFSISSMVFIWNDKVGFMSTKKEGISFTVVSKDFSEMMRSFFNFVWDKSDTV